VFKVESGEREQWSKKHRRWLPQKGRVQDKLPTQLTAISATWNRQHLPHISITNIQGINGAPECRRLHHWRCIEACFSSKALCDAPYLPPCLHFFFPSRSRFTD